MTCAGDMAGEPAAPPWRAFLAGAAGRLTTGIVWNVTGAVFNSGSTFVLGIIVAKTLGRELYGVYGFLQTTLLMLSNLAYLALGFTATKYVGEYRVRDKARAGRVIGLCAELSALGGIAAMIAALLFAGPIAVNLARQPAFASILRLGSPAVFLVAVIGALTAALAGMQRFRSIAFIGAVSGVAYVAIGATGAVRWSLPGVAAGLSVSALLQCTLALVVLKRAATAEGIHIPLITPKLIAAERPMLVHTAMPAALSGLTALPTLWIITAILARRDHGMSEVALFAAANSLRLLVSFVPGLINNVGFSVLSGHKGSADHRAYWSIFRMNLLIVTGVAAAGAAVIGIGGPYLLRLYGRSFDGGYPVLLLLLTATLADAVSIALYQIIQTHGNMWLSLLGIAIPRDLTVIALAAVLTRWYGAVGLAIAVLGGALVMLTSVLVIVVRTRHAVAAPIGSPR